MSSVNHERFTGIEEGLLIILCIRCLFVCLFFCIPVNSRDLNQGTRVHP